MVSVEKASDQADLLRKAVNLFTFLGDRKSVV